MPHSCLEVHSLQFRGADRPITWPVWEVERAAAYSARLASPTASSCMEKGNKGSQSLSAPRAPPFQLLQLGCYGNSSLWGDLAIFISGLTASPRFLFARKIITCHPPSPDADLTSFRLDWATGLFMRLIVWHSDSQLISVTQYLALCPLKITGCGIDWVQLHSNQVCITRSVQAQEVNKKWNQDYQKLSFKLWKNNLIISLLPFIWPDVYVNAIMPLKQTIKQPVSQ